MILDSYEALLKSNKSTDPFFRTKTRLSLVNYSRLYRDRLNQANPFLLQIAPQVIGLGQNVVTH
jgi:hypothetical protein